MKRRTFIVRSGLGLGTLGLGIFTATNCQQQKSPMYNETVSVKDVEMMNELGEIIIPATDTPGAKEARVGEFMAVVIQDCYSDEERHQCKETLNEINQLCVQDFGRDFLVCTKQERESVMAALEEGSGGYKSLKNLIVSSYLSSETGMTQFFKYTPIPGTYNGCAADRPW